MAVHVAMVHVAIVKHAGCKDEFLSRIVKKRTSLNYPKGLETFSETLLFGRQKETNEPKEGKSKGENNEKQRIRGNQGGLGEKRNDYGKGGKIKGKGGTKEAET